jgi:hypothetical protein
MTAYARQAFGLTVDTCTDKTDKWMRVWDGEDFFWVRRGATSQSVSWDDARSYKAVYAAWCLSNCAPADIAAALDAAEGPPRLLRVAQYRPR